MMGYWDAISTKGLLWCAAALVIYLCAINIQSEAEYLKSVTPVQKLEDLAPLLNGATTVLPFVMSVSGLVGSDTPIKCEYSDMHGVIVEKKQTQHYLKRNDTGEWNAHKRVLHSIWNAVPWYLYDSTGRVYVTGAQGTTDLPLTFGGRLFEPSRESVDHVKKVEEQGLKMLGVEKIENVLPLNKYLTVVGEVSKDYNGKIQIGKPSAGGFYVTVETVGELIALKQGCSRCLKFVSVLLMVVGVFYLAKSAIEYIERRRLLDGLYLVFHSIRTRIQIFIGHADKMDKDFCRICFEREYNTVFIPCGHMCCCMTCSSSLIQCPICRARIKGKVRTFCS